MLTAITSLVMTSILLGAIAMFLLKISSVLDACRKVVKSAKKLIESIKH